MGKALPTAQPYNDKAKQANKHDKPDASGHTHPTDREVFCRIPHESIPDID